MPRLAASAVVTASSCGQDGTRSESVCLGGKYLDEDVVQRSRECRVEWERVRGVGGRIGC